MTDIPRFKNPHINTYNNVPNTSVTIDVTAVEVIDDGEADDRQSALDAMERIANMSVFGQDQLAQRGIQNSSEEEASRPSKIAYWFKNGKTI
jgi:Flp pilus assembly secretin CpaC